MGDAAAESAGGGLWNALLGSARCAPCTVRKRGSACDDALDAEAPAARVLDGETLSETTSSAAGGEACAASHIGWSRRASSSASRFNTWSSSTFAPPDRGRDAAGAEAAAANGPLLQDSPNPSESQAADAVLSDPSDHRHMLRVFHNVHKAARAFRKTDWDHQIPSAEELARGVQVQKVYEFFDLGSRKIRLRKMNDDVWHQRGRRSPSELKTADENDEDVSPSSSSSTAGSTPTALLREMTSDSLPSGMSDTRSGDVIVRKKMLKRAVTSSNTEVVTTWGALVGKVLHSKVLDFSALKDKAIRKHKYQIQTDGASHRMVARLQDRARIVVRQAEVLGKKLAKEPDRFDSEWTDPSLLTYLFSTEYLDTLMLLTNVACKLLATQPSMAVASAPCKIFGDIHGQLRDLLILFCAFGSPSEDTETNFVFNGDFVDRGQHQLEVVGVLLSLKVLYPDRVWLVRGNHEDRHMNERYGFQDSCNRLLGSEFGPKVFELMQSAFNRLPVACLVAEKILCVHGGIGDGTWKLEDLRTIPRPLVGETLLHPVNSWIFNILWSDPIEDGKDADPTVFGVHESPRGGVAAQFAWNITKTFCARNGLSLIVRSHQSKKGSRGFDVMHENLLVRVFSARDYEGQGNDGAVLQVTKSEDQDGLLVVRPQVVRSVKKTRDEEARHARAEGTAKTPRTPGGPEDKRRGRRISTGRVDPLGDGAPRSPSSSRRGNESPQGGPSPRGAAGSGGGYVVERSAGRKQTRVPTAMGG